MGELNRLCSAIFRDKQYPNKSVCDAFVILISQFLENNMFSIEMDMRMLFHSSKGLEKQWLLKFY